MKSTTFILIMCAVALLGLPARAQAYLDPTTGSMVLQVVIGGFLAAAAATRLYWSKVKRLFGRKDEPKNATERVRAGGAE